MTETTTTIQQPQATLYVSNIDWKVKKNLLKRSLYSLFSRHGKVLDVITFRHSKLRGQAWVIYDNIPSATNALQQENKLSFFGKELNIEYAKEKSDRIAKMDGTYIPKAKRQKLQQIKNQISSSSSDQQQQPMETNSTDVPSKATKVEQSSSTEVPLPSSSTTTTTEKNEMKQETASASATTSESTNEPSNILFANNLPDECNEMMLAMLFRQYVGFVEVRTPRTGIAFIEFNEKLQASAALKGLNGFNLTPTDKLNLSYSSSS